MNRQYDLLYRFAYLNQVSSQVRKIKEGSYVATFRMNTPLRPKLKEMGARRFRAAFIRMVCEETI